MSQLVEMPKLYKRDSVGKIRQWSIIIDGSKYATISGVKDGALVQSEWTQAKIKNEGRANATTPERQAEMEAQSEYTKKQKLGYTPDLNLIDKQKFMQCMLAKDYNDHKHKLKGVVLVQPKLDGIRCIARADGLYSRKGEKIVSCPHIEEALKPIFEQSPDVVFDGELYNHNLKDNFNKIASLVNKKKSIEPEALKVIQYHIYDLVNDEVSSVARGNFRQSFLNTLPEDGPLVSVETWMYATSDNSQIQEWVGNFHAKFTELGYEGTMIRTDTVYQHKRTDALLKFKDFTDAEFVILDVIEGEGNRAGMAGALKFETMEGTEFTANIIGGFEYYKELLSHKDKYIGRYATVKYFALTPDGIPRFPVVKTIR